MKLFAACLALFASTSFTGSIMGSQVPQRPHVVLILADDLGYGDVHEDTLPTPEMDRIAAEGLSFLDAHSPSAVCTPTRYGLLTGRYAWRTRLKNGVLGGYSKPLMQPDRRTLGHLLGERGYVTHAVGKWHLGMDLPLADSEGDVTRWGGDPGIDFEATIQRSPTSAGFDHYFGVTASLDMPPYVWIRDDRFTQVPTIQQEGVSFPRFVRQGPRAADFAFDRVLERLFDEAIAAVQSASEGEQPLFLYLPLTAPHKPAWPREDEEAVEPLGPYGRLVQEVDQGIGRLRRALEKAEMWQDTLFLVTSDNGSYMYAYEPGTEDHTQQEEVHGFATDNHRANGAWRGTKADIYEAGHHVPLLVSWPGVAPAGVRPTPTVCLTDLFATLAEITAGESATLSPTEGEDSFSLLPLLRGETEFERAPVVHHSVNGTFALREGPWKLILSDGSGGRAKPRGKPFQAPYQLYHLANDPTESDDLAARQVERVEHMIAQLEALREAGRSRP